MEIILPKDKKESDITISLSSPEIDKIIPLFKEGQYFSKGEKIAKYFYKQKDDNNNKNDNNKNNNNNENNENKNNKIEIEKKPIYIPAPIYGFIKKLLLEEKKIILSPCLHEAFYGN